MATFFSGTDMSELHENVGNHNFYLSLIVNFNGIYTARVAYISTVKEQISGIIEFTNSDDEPVVLETEERTTEVKYMVMINMEIEKEAIESNLSENFVADLPLSKKQRRKLRQNLQLQQQDMFQKQELTLGDQQEHQLQVLLKQQELVINQQEERLLPYMKQRIKLLQEQHILSIRSVTIKKEKSQKYSHHHNIKRKKKDKSQRKKGKNYY